MSLNYLLALTTAYFVEFSLIFLIYFGDKELSYMVDILLRGLSILNPKSVANLVSNIYLIYFGLVDCLILIDF